MGQVEVDDSFADMSDADQQSALQYITKQYSDGIATNMENAPVEKQKLRALAQGLTLGFGDELEGGKRGKAAHCA